VPESNQHNHASEDIGRKHLPPASFEQKMQEQRYTRGDQENEDQWLSSVPREKGHQTKQEAQKDQYFEETHDTEF
jgi:hypothetical protein